MKKIYTKKEFVSLSNEKLREITKGKAVNFHFTDGRWTQLCANDLQGFDSMNGCFYTKTDIKISLQNVDYIEIFDVADKG